MKHLPGEACSAMQHILITATSNYREEKNHKAGFRILFSKKTTRHLKNNRKAAALTIRPEAASPSALKNSTRIQSHLEIGRFQRAGPGKMNYVCQGLVHRSSEPRYPQSQRSLEPGPGNEPTHPSFWVHQRLLKVRFPQTPHTYSSAQGGRAMGRVPTRTTSSLSD